MDLKLNFRHLTNSNYGRPKMKQNQLLQDLIRPHIESFNCILYEGLPKMLANIEPVQFALPNGDHIALTIQDIIISPPKVHERSASTKTLKIYPAECRGRGTTYSGALQIQIGFSVNGLEGPQISRNLGNIPVMVKSDICNLAKLSPAELIRRGEEAEEMGGYFIINGIERVVRMLILPRRNYPLCVIRSTWKNRGSLYTEYGIMVRCVRSDHTALNMTLHYLNNGSAELCFFFNKEIFYAPIALILKGLLDVCDKYIYDELVKGKEDDAFYKGCILNMLRLESNDKLMTREGVLRYIGSIFRVRLNYFIPEWYTDEEAGKCLYRLCICVHLTSDMDKFNYLVYLTRKLFDFAKGKCAEESGDNIMFQEALLGGHLYQMILKEKLQGYMYQLKSIIERQARSHKSGPDLYRVTADSISHALHYCPELAKSVEYFFSTGNLVSYSGLGLLQETGMTVVADKLNFMRYISHFRCVHRGAFFAEMRTTTVRKLLPEAWGFLCPVHTPDGSPCGLMNHATSSCQVFTCQQQPLIKALFSLGICAVDAPFCNIKECYTVLLDGKVVGYLADDLAQEVETMLRVMKVKGLHNIPATTEICLVKKTKYHSQYPGLYIFTTPARMIRPVKNLAINMVEMIGTFEQVYMDICINQNEAYKGITTHQELSDTGILSVATNLIPFSDFNQSPRNMYQCQMGKQTMGVSLHSLPFRSDNKIYKLQTPQSPLVRPAKYDEYDIDNYPLGTNAIVAVISYTGYDMEDAMVINKGSFQRGFAHATVYKSEIIDLSTTLKLNYQTTPLIFACKPDSNEVKRGLLDIDGLPPIGAYLENGKPYYSYINTQNGEQKLVYYKNIESAYVEHIKVLGSDTGVRLRSKVSIMLRINRNPVIGDKFASRHGQKGICSMMYALENMPFTESGMTPDIIFNPHGYPSRMTIGLMIESMAGKAASLFGHCYDATPFQFSEDDSPVDYFGDLLVKAGFNYHGTEKMFSGVDGRELEANIFMGVVYYQRLRHMVSDKFQVRTTGPVDQVTFQPVKGRKKHGGVRFGEMERDALIAHGTSFLLQDRLLNCSDKSMSPLCTKCGSLISVFLEKRASVHAAASFEKQREWKCLLCKSSKDIEVIVVPYVLRYLAAELAAMNIRMNLAVK